MSKKTKKKLALADLLTAHLEESNQSQRAFAEAHGLPKTTVQQIAAGTVQTLSVDNARILAPILGRSIAELIGLDETEIGSNGGAGAAPAALTDRREIKVSNIITAPTINPRKTFSEEGIRELADSIERDGVLENLVVRDNLDGKQLGPTTIVATGEQLFELIAGERRLRACRLLIDEGRKPKDWTVPCLIKNVDNQQARALALLENLQRIDLAPLEEADAFHVLTTDFGWTTAQIAERIHKSQRFVQQRLALATKLSAEVKDALTQGTLKIDQARALTAADEKEQKKLLKDIETNPYGLSTAEDIRKRLTRNAILSTAAIFDLKKYTGATRDDDEGNVWLLDPAEFKKLQKEAVLDLKADKEAEGWAFVEVCSYFHAADYEEQRTKKKKDGIVVIDLDWRGNVEVHEGLIPNKEEWETLEAYIENAREAERENAEIDAEEAARKAETPEERKERQRIEAEKREAEREKKQKAGAELNEKLTAFFATNPLLKARFALARVYDDRDLEGGEWTRISALSAEELLAEFAELAFRNDYDEEEDVLINPYNYATDADISILEAAGIERPEWFELRPVHDEAEDADAGDQGDGDDAEGDEVDGDHAGDDEAEEAA